MMDIVSEKLEMDPIAFRKKNYTRTGDIGVMEQPITSCGMEDCLERGAKLIGWDRRKPAGSNSGKTLRGFGMASMTHSSGSRTHLADYSAAIVSFNEDGSVQLRTGSSDVGTGSDTTLSQIAAEELGVSLDAVRVISGDTDATPFDRGAYSTRTLFVAGSAAKAAAMEAKSQLIAWAAGKLEASLEDLEIRSGQIFVKGSPTRGTPLSQITREASRVTKGAMSFIGSASFENPSCASGFGTHFVEVEIDTETGKVTLLKVAAVMDVGRAINPTVVEGQIEGALQQGLGYALSENPVIDSKTGTMLNADFANYIVATSLDMPEIKIHLVEPIDPTGPFGAKGVGETCILGIAPAIANAIYNAIGIRFFELPITAEKIFMALRKKASPDR
jgi:xanthine dehydrogenase molybdenum-binding subunit